jgi:hypothetical protein
MGIKSRRPFGLLAAVAIFSACSAKPRQASALLPKENVVEVKVVQRELLGKAFMPGGALARYQKGKDAYEIFLGKLPTPTDSAIVLAHWDQVLKNPKVIPSLDAYYGVDANRPIFVFAKGQWVAGIAGLPEKEADQQARILAGRL